MSKWGAKQRRNVIIAALDKQGGRCFYCLSPLAVEKASADHRVPTSKGGRDVRDNIVAACFPCNTAKADLAESWFFRTLNQKTPPRIGGSEMMLIWASRRIWKRADRACRRIERRALGRTA